MQGFPAPPIQQQTLAIEVADDAMHLTAALVPSAPEQWMSGDIRLWHRSLVSPATPDELRLALVALAREALRSSDDRQSDAVVPLSVALWCVVDADTGVVVRWRRLPGWANVHLRDDLQAAWPGPVTVDAAVRDIALAEHRISARQLTGPLLYIHIGRAIWSATVDAHGVRAGWQGQAGALGHMLVQPIGPRCSCGERGHLEPLASTQSLVRNYIGKASATEEGTRAMLAASRGRAEAISVRQIVALGQRGDHAAHAVIEDGLAALTLALANACVLTAPEHIVLGGPIVQAGDAWLAQLGARLTSAVAATLAPPSVRWAVLREPVAVRGALGRVLALSTSRPDDTNPSGL